MGVLRTLRRSGPIAAMALLSCAIWHWPLASAATTTTAAPTPTEVEAVFLFNFSQFVDWPPLAFPDTNSPIIIGVLGTDPFGTTLDDVVRGETVNGRTLVIRRFRRIEELSDCHILYIGRSEHDGLKRILETLKGRNVLTVSDVEDFAREGGIVGFVLAQNKVHLRINLDAARTAGLTLSSKLLRPAQIVGGEN